MHNTMTGRSLRSAVRYRTHATATLAAVLMAGVALPAMAGTLRPAPMEPTVPAPYTPAPVATAAHWEGGYAGFTMGYNFRGRDRVRLAPAPPGVIGTMRVRGALLGVQGGYNWQNGSTVFGVEAALNLTRTRDAITDGPASASMRINPVADLRGRVGWAINDGLLYAAGGLSVGRIQYSASDGLTSDINSTYNRLGYTVGLGYEQQIGNNWSMRGEYSYTQYRGRNLTDGVHTTRATPDFHSVRVGLNRRF
ncbi:MAG: porin family protein [Pararhodobacter sp.]|nr:porin family protein [Pararhodobacter sp.]